MKITITHGDITKFQGDAIVNAANINMMGGGGVDGAIHRAAGPELKATCAKHPEVTPGVRCPVGEARLTHGFNLPAEYVIHTVGPMWFDSPTCRAPHWPGESVQKGDPRELLKDCIVSSLRLAQDRDIETIAIPAISCGVFGGAIVTFAKVLHEAVTGIDFTGVKELTVVLFQESEYETFRQTWAILG